VVQVVEDVHSDEVVYPVQVSVVEYPVVHSEVSMHDV
jgi:hypothetical protein